LITGVKLLRTWSIFTRARSLPLGKLLVCTIPGCCLGCGPSPGAGGGAGAGASIGDAGGGECLFA